jgi:hypothetical protein
MAYEQIAPSREGAIPLVYAKRVFRIVFKTPAECIQFRIGMMMCLWLNRAH